MELTEVFIYLVDKRESFDNEAAWLHEESSHVGGYEKILFQKLEKKQMIVKEDGTPYTPGADHWNNYDITLDLASLGHLVILNGGFVEDNWYFDVAIPEELSPKLIRDFELLKSQLDKFHLNCWIVKKDRSVIEYNDVQLFEQNIDQLGLILPKLEKQK